MIRAAIGFFVLGLVAMLLGAYNVAGFSIEVGKILLGVFLFLAVLSFIGHLISGGRTKSIVSIFLALLGIGGVSVLHIPTVHADDTPSQAAQKSADNASTSAKKTTRKAKKSIRKATGTDTVAKDAKDKAADVGDDVSNTAKKAKVDTQ